MFLGFAAGIVASLRCSFSPEGPKLKVLLRHSQCSQAVQREALRQMTRIPRLGWKLSIYTWADACTGAANRATLTRSMSSPGTTPGAHSQQPRE